MCEHVGNDKLLSVNLAFSEAYSSCVFKLQILICHRELSAVSSDILLGR